MSELVKETSDISPCLKCGKCCYLSFITDDGVIDTDVPCSFLKDNICTVYHNRPDWCLTAKEMIDKKILPIGCGYKKGD